MSQQSLQAKLALHGNQANAVLLRADGYLVLDTGIAEIEVARSIARAIVAETSGQHACHLGPGVAVGQQFHACSRLQKEYARILRIGHLDMTNMKARRDPFPLL